MNEPEAFGDSHPNIAPPRIEPPSRPAPSVLASVVLYLVVVFVGAALIAPPLYATIHVLAESHGRLRPLAAEPFYRYVSRCLLALALLGLPQFFKSLRMPSAGALGLKGGLRHWGELLEGFAWGFAALAFAAVLSVSFHARGFNLDHLPYQWSKYLRGAIIASCLVPLIEEVLFRGALFGALRRERAFWSAALISSAVYAIVHFFEHPPEPPAVHWHSGFVMLGEMLRGFIEWKTLVPGFFNLLLAGLIFCLALERTGSLLFPMGLHAGFIFWVKSFGFFTRQLPNTGTSIWGSDKLVDGWSTGVLLLLMFFALRRILPQKRKAEENA